MRPRPYTPNALRDSCYADAENGRVPFLPPVFFARSCAWNKMSLMCIFDLCLCPLFFVFVELFFWIEYAGMGSQGNDMGLARRASWG